MLCVCLCARVLCHVRACVASCPGAVEGGSNGLAGSTMKS